ncbi:root hair defective 3 GTP-binding protein [Sistotremastrum suecicum HHB10207 ss-3]|uniref:Root hair defective 3 GTP-binding protein n=1 Tax=Sistotremastrum suecicum HHB10207 ss-3 TaxID=1314776 RepID=A0A166FL74_9AGAM|nr:root hair defective 3 GTP-binding protein [Sistotremastrum suecicum HHB10207 ss-3]
MDMNVQSAQNLLRDPPKDIKEIMDASTGQTKAALDVARANVASINGHTPSGSKEIIQIINDEKEFTKDLAQQINSWGLRDAGFGYDIVAVFGSQSTGKSTLLNRLFGTNFGVMDEAKRQQTTKGIWMCKGSDMNVLVMDVEGADGRERGEDQDFERKAALFSLASSEVMIVNLWEHQVGLYQGANMGLLKTVFEVNLGLFGKRTKDGPNQRTLLLFVIRDHLGTTPLSNLQQTLTTDLLRIWDSLSKPSEVADAKLEDYFDLAFTGLPHKILAADAFESEVQELRKKFVDKTNEGYYFKSGYHKRIPADGVALYMEGIWEQVQSNKDLDLPTQQELLAQFRCDEISSVALEEFNLQAKSRRRPVETGNVVEGLGKLMSSWKTTALSRYDRDASRYHNGVYSRKRAELLAAIDSSLLPLFVGQLKNIHKAVLVEFKSELALGLQGESYNFAEVVSSAKAKSETNFSEGAKEAAAAGNEQDGWSWTEELELLREEVQAVADQFRSDETKKMVNAIERSLKRQIAEPVEVLFIKPTPDIWDSVLITYRDVLLTAESKYLQKAKSFNCTAEENKSSLETLRRRAWTALRTKIGELTSDTVVLGRLRTQFEEQFRYDVHGVPRVWKPGDDIDAAFRKARDETLELIPLYAKINPKDESLVPSFNDPVSTPAPTSDEDIFDFSSSLVIFPETKIIDLSTRFRRDADAYYVEAKRSMVSSIAQIPLWMYGVLVVLGWNEAMAVLFNPLYFTLLLISVAGAWITIQLGLVGPLFQVARTVTNEVQRQATKKLREQFAEPQLNAPIPASSGGSRNSTQEEDWEDKEASRYERKLR